jgi:hypothetical protein
MTTLRESYMTVDSIEAGRASISIPEGAHISEWVDAFVRAMLFLGYQNESIESAFEAYIPAHASCCDIEFADDFEEQPDHNDPWEAVVASFEKYYPKVAKYVKQCELAEVLNGEATVTVKDAKAFEELSKTTYMTEMDSVLSAIVGEKIQAILVYDVKV